MKFSYIAQENYLAITLNMLHLTSIAAGYTIGKSLVTKNLKDKQNHIIN